MEKVLKNTSAAQPQGSAPAPKKEGSAICVSNPKSQPAQTLEELVRQQQETIERHWKTLGRRKVLLATREDLTQTAAILDETAEDADVEKRNYNLPFVRLTLTVESPEAGGNKTLSISNRHLLKNMVDRLIADIDAKVTELELQLIEGVSSPLPVPAPVTEVKKAA